ncbi:MAG: caspase family protein [Candidatus Sulfotelmatobacter sp.]
MNRQAILLLNSIGFEPETRYPRSLLSSIESDLDGNLSRLGDFSFECSSIRDKTADEANRKLKAEIKKCRQNGCDLLLFYYFGHAILSEQDLRLFFKDSDATVSPTMLGFKDVVSMITGFGIRRVIFVLDCCYAGAGADHIALQPSRNWEYCLLAAATGTAETVASERPSMGIFTSNLVKGFGDKQAAEPGSNEVTFKSIFKFAKEETENTAREQEPYLADGGLGEELFFRQQIAIRVLPYLNDKAPRKSSYHKVYLLATYLSDNKFASLKALYNYAKREDDVAFRTPVRTKRGADYIFMSIASFSGYVELLRDLNALSNSGLQLNENGRQLVVRKGMKFNETLWALIQDYWKSLGFTVADVLQAITSRVRVGQEPTATAIRLFLFQRNRTRVSPERMRQTLDLAGYVNAIPYCSEKTFYPVP